MRHLVLALCMALWLAACHQPDPLLRIGTNTWPGYEPFYLARHQGLYDQRNIRLVELPSATDVIDAIRLGSLEGGALTLDEVLTLSSEGIDLTVVLICNISNGADVLMAHPSIAQLSDLADKTIAVETSAVGALMLHSVLQQAELTLSDVTVKHMPLSQHVAAFHDRQIDASITFEPYATQLLSVGAARLFDSRQIPNTIIDVLAIRTDALQPHEQQLRHLIHGFFNARQRIMQHESEALSAVNLRLQMPEADLLRAYSELIMPDKTHNQHLLQNILPEKNQRLTTLMQTHQLLPPHVFAPPKFTDRLLSP